MLCSSARKVRSDGYQCHITPEDCSFWWFSLEGLRETLGERPEVSDLSARPNESS